MLEELSEGTIGDELLPVDALKTPGCIPGVEVRFENAPVTYSYVEFSNSTFQMRQVR